MLARIRTRVDVRIAVGEQPGRRFMVTITNDGTRAIGTITSVNALGEPSARALGGADCTDVVDALGLVAAMTLHPELQIDEGARVRAADVHPVPVAVTPNVTAAAASTPNPSEANVRGIHADADEVEPSRANGGRHFHLHGGGQAELMFGYVPAVLFGTTARLELLDVSQQIVHSAFGVGFSALRPTEQSLGEASASLTWTLGQLVACPVHFGLSQSVSVLPCGRVDVGRLHAVGQNIANARDRNLLWLSAGVLAKFAWIGARHSKADPNLKTWDWLTSLLGNLDGGGAIDDDSGGDAIYKCMELFA